MKWLILGLFLLAGQDGISQVKGGDDRFGEAGYTFEELDLNQVRFWHGKNGKSISGVFLMEEKGLIHVRSDRASTVYKLAPKNLSQKTLDWYEAAKAFRDGKPRKIDPNDPFITRKPKGSGEDDFKPVAGDHLERSRIKPIDPTAYGLKDHSNEAHCFVPFFIWWDQNGNLPIPRGRRFEQKAQWICKELEKRFERGRYLGKAEEFRDCFRGYFNDYFKDEASFTFMESRFMDAASLPKATKGSAGTALRLMIYSGDRLQWHTDSALVDAKNDGSVTLIAYNQEMGASIVPLTEEESGDLRTKAKYWQVKLDPGTPIPERLKKLRDFRFLISESSSLFVFQPLVKEKKEDPPAEKP